MYIFLTCQSEKYTIGERFIIVLKTKQMFLIIFYAKFKMALWRVLGIDKCGISDLRYGCRRTSNLRASRSGAAAKHTLRKSKQKNDRKTKPKARRRGAVPAEPLGRRLPLFPPRNAFFHWLYSRSMYLLNLLFRSAMVA